MKLTAKEKEFVLNSRVARIATVGADGVPHNVPVCPIYDKDRIYFATEKSARKIRNLKANSNVTMVFDEYSESWSYIRGVMVQCEARVVKAKDFKTLRKKIYGKYAQYEKNAALGERDSVIVELSPRHKFSWGLD